MDRRIEEDVEGWPTRPLQGGYEGLRELASADFSGAASARGSWLFMLNGRIVGVFDGDLEDFEDAQGSVYKAPHRSVPLLYAMQEHGGDTRAKYYTNDTPISEVDDTLSSGGFTGYVELSENVLSGDYYVVYHQGRAMSLAYVGNSERLIVGEEAFERADDEVGIFEVVDVDVPVLEVPEPDEPEDSGTDQSVSEENESRASGDDTGDPARDVDDANDVDADEGTADDESTTADDSADTEEVTEAPASSVADESAEEAPADDADADGAGAAADETPSTDVPSADDASAGDDASAADAPAEASDGDAQSAARSAESDRPSSAREDRTAGASSTGDATRSTGGQSSESTERGSTRDQSRAAGPTTTAAAERSGASGGSADRFTREEAWREATRIPSLDPDDTATEPPEPAQSAASASEPASQTTAATSPERSRTTATREEPAGDTFEREVLEREDRIDSLEQRASDLEGERDELARERDRLLEEVDELESENDDLRAEIRRLESEIEELESVAARDAAAASADAGGPQQLARHTAFEGTDLFVRYHSKGKPTLESAHDQGADAAEVNENLRLDVHTRFEADEATVDGESFEAFLHETMRYRFVEWLVRVLPYEIRETGGESGLRDLYDALPEVDRVEFDGNVELTYQEGGETVNEEESFDVVVRDKMGEALVVADMNDSREPATSRMLVDLQEGAQRVKESGGALAAAFLVTRSFFEPAALETVGEATSGSLLSRDSRRSYVKVSRKQGYHLCLVEARGDELYMNTPEL